MTQTDTSLFVFLITFSILMPFVVTAVGGYFGETELNLDPFNLRPIIEDFNVGFDYRETDEVSQFTNFPYVSLRFKSPSYDLILHSPRMFNFDYYPELNADLNGIFAYYQRERDTGFFPFWRSTVVDHFLILYASYEPTTQNLEEHLQIGFYDSTFTNIPTFNETSDLGNIMNNPDYYNTYVYFDDNQNNFMEQYIRLKYDEFGDEGLIRTLRTLTRNFNQGIQILPTTLNTIIFGIPLVLFGYIITKIIRGF